MTTCPECRQGKHRNCTGIAWDLLIDAPVPCDCSRCEPVVWTCPACETDHRHTTPEDGCDACGAGA